MTSIWPRQPDAMTASVPSWFFGGGVTGTWFMISWTSRSFWYLCKNYQHIRTNIIQRVNDRSSGLRFNIKISYITTTIGNTIKMVLSPQWEFLILVRNIYVESWTPDTQMKIKLTKYIMQNWKCIWMTAWIFEINYAVVNFQEQMVKS